MLNKIIMNRIVFITFIVALLVALSPVYSHATGDFDPAEYDNIETETDRREWVLRFSPHAAYLAKNSSNADPLLSRLGIRKRLTQFVYILLNADLDLQMYRNWFVTGSFIYSHAFYKNPVDGGINIFGFPFGIKYALLEDDYDSDGDSFLDRSRYWVGGFVGPYVKYESITINLGARKTHGSSTNVAVGVGAHTGFDYFISSNFGLGIQVKVQYIYFDDDLIIFSGGPSLIGRF